jgi:Ser/Thr protein kinase RdoA (MazF antagonist)
VTDDQWFTHLLRDAYAVEPQAIDVLSGSNSTDRRVARVAFRDGSAWIVRVYAGDGLLVDWLSGCGDRTNAQWLASRTATLNWLAHVGYAAPQPVPAQGGSGLGWHDDWCAQALSFVSGGVLDTTPARLHQLGAALGRLHTLPAPDDAPVGRSWWDAPEALARAADHLRAAASVAPERWRATLERFAGVVDTIRATPLARALIHADAWAGNVVYGPDESVTLIDWDAGGFGAPVLDLGRTLWTCHLTLSDPLSVHLAPDAEYIRALLSGYLSQRQLSAEELAVLAEAACFSIAYGVAWHLATVPIHGWDERTEARMRRRKAWADAASTIASIATRELAGSRTS